MLGNKINSTRKKQPWVAEKMMGPVDKDGK